MQMPDMVVMLDPPRHVPMRRVVSGRFTPKAVRARQADVERMGAEILDGAVTGGDGGECDFVERIAAPLPLAVIAWMLGVPARRLGAAVPVEQRGDRQATIRSTAAPGESPGQTIAAGARRAPRATSRG